MKQYPFDNSEWVTCDADLHKLYLFNESAEYDFEGVTFAGMKDYNGYLTAAYGDYMQLPPEDKRVSNHFAKIDLNKSYKQ